MDLSSRAVSFSAIGLATLSFLVSGCGPAAPPTAEVTGTVTYNGNPVANASVTFYPASGRPATGATDASGKFTLAATPGAQKVAVIPIEEFDPDAIAGDPDAVETPPPFPVKYQSMDDSGLTADAKEGQINDVTFELTD